MAGFEAMRETSTLREMKSYQLPADMAIDDIFANMASGRRSILTLSKIPPWPWRRSSAA